MIKRIWNKFFRREQVVTLDSYIVVMTSWAIERIHMHLEEENHEYSAALYEEFAEMVDPRYDDYELFFATKVN